jgi:hypothetical protein
MQKLIRSLTIAGLVAGLLTFPGFISGNNKNVSPVIASNTVSTTNNSSNSALEAEASTLYDAIAINGDISMKTLIYALKGFKYLQGAGKLSNTSILSIVDFSQSSRKKRFYIIDVANKKLLYNTYVAHGRNSGAEYATSFSNDMDSHKSSLGFYVTNNTYNGAHGLSLRIDGMEKGFNDNALERDIVVHGANYMGDNFLKSCPFSGRSWGCPAVPASETSKVINIIKNGSCLFIYHPSENYIAKSKILNADLG